MTDKTFPIAEPAKAPQPVIDDALVVEEPISDRPLWARSIGVEKALTDEAELLASGPTREQVMLSQGWDCGCPATCPIHGDRANKIEKVGSYTGLTEDQIRRFVGCLLAVGLEIAESASGLPTPTVIPDTKGEGEPTMVHRKDAAYKHLLTISKRIHRAFMNGNHPSENQLEQLEAAIEAVEAMKLCGHSIFEECICYGT